MWIVPGEWRELRSESQQFVGYEIGRRWTPMLLAFRQEGGSGRGSVAGESRSTVESGGQVSDTGIVAGQGWDLPVDQVS